MGPLSLGIGLCSVKAAEWRSLRLSLRRCASLGGQSVLLQPASRFLGDRVFQQTIGKHGPYDTIQLASNGCLSQLYPHLGL
jgi:hypothetical protein